MAKFPPPPTRYPAKAVQAKSISARPDPPPPTRYPASAAQPKRPPAPPQRTVLAVSPRGVIQRMEQPQVVKAQANNLEEFKALEYLRPNENGNTSLRLWRGDISTNQKLNCWEAILLYLERHSIISHSVIKVIVRGNERDEGVNFNKLLDKATKEDVAEKNIAQNKIICFCSALCDDNDPDLTIHQFLLTKVAAVAAR